MANLVIFDCDGTLIDSEPIANRVTAEVLSDMGYPIAAEESHQRFTGLTMANIRTVVEEETGVALPENFEVVLHRESLAVFKDELQPVHGIANALQRITKKKCVASNSQMEKLELALNVTNLQNFFDPAHVFSAQHVARGKPHPDLFLLAAEKFDVRPQDCIVVEDSPTGVQAGRAADMIVLGFTGTADDPIKHRLILEDAGADLIFDDMQQLPALVNA